LTLSPRLQTAKYLQRPHMIFPQILRSFWSVTESMDTNFDCHDRWTPGFSD